MRIKRETGVAQTGNQRRRAGFRPMGEQLEERKLLAAIDLVNIAGNDTVAGPGPYGILEAGLNNNGGVGYSVAMVGDVNGDGFDDFVLGAPTIQAVSAGPVLGQGSGVAYLVFGSAQVNGANVNWLNLTAQQRIGDLSQLGNITQNNPVNGSTGWSYNGLTITASQNPNNRLGASVRAVGDVNGDGFADFMLGAPGALDSTGTTGNTGRAYLIYGGAALSARSNKLLDLDNSSANTDLNIITFVSNQLGGFAGASVAGVGDVISDGFTDIAVGAPLASLNGLGTNGAVYVINGGFLRPARTQTVNLSNVGQGGSTNVPGIIFAGALSGDQAGWSVSSAGNFDNDTNSAGQGIADLLIGAPQSTTGSGIAYLVYGAVNLGSLGIVQNGINNISLARLAPGATNPVAGAIFTGASNGDRTGFSVAFAGDFNADGISDISIGSPFWDGPLGIDSGRVSLIFGRGINPNPPGRITGIFSLSALPSSIPFVQFDGPGTNAQAGFSSSAVGRINNDAITEFLIGAPGFNNTQGIVYLIPGNPDLQGEFRLNVAQGGPIFATLITLSNPLSGNFLGSSVSGSLFSNGSNQTMDADVIADFIVGAAGFALNTSRNLAGGGYALEGAFVPLDNIVSNAITSPIAVQSYPSAAVINPATPDDLTFFILSSGSNTAGFAPFDDLNPDTIQVNGILLPDPSTWANAGDLDGDGIDDATFIFSPRSLLGLPGNSNVTLTISGRTLTTSPFPNRRYSGSINVRTSGSSPTPPQPGISLTFGPQFENLNRAAPRYGERLLPQLQVINRARWAALSTRLAYRQFVPQGNFGYRQRNFFHGTTQEKRGTRTLAKNVFTRGRFPTGVHIGATKYNQPVINNGQKHIYPK